MFRVKFDLFIFLIFVYCMRNENEVGLLSFLLLSINLEFYFVVRIVKI